MSGVIGFDFGFSAAGKSSRPRESDPVKILVLRDFPVSSGPDRSEPLPAIWAHPVDIDTLDKLLGRFAPTLELQLDGDLTAPVTFSAIDDFHPDSLYRRLSMFDELHNIVQRLSNKQTFPEAAAQLPGNSPWSLIIGTYTFDASSLDVTMLAALGAVAAQAGGPFLAATSPTILGCPSLTETPNPRDWNPEAQKSENWNALRQSQIGPWHESSRHF